MGSVLLDIAGHRRSPATMPGYHRGRPPRNKGEQYPADPPTIEEIVAVMRTVGDRADGHRLRALIVLLWRAGLRISEALALHESDLDRSRGAILVRPWQGRQTARGRDGSLGVGPARLLDRDSPRAPDRCAPVCDPRTDRWSALRSLGRAQATASRRCRGRRPSAIRAAPAPARARGRDGPRGRPARRHPAPARTPTLASPASTSKASTAARSSTPSTDDRRQRSPPAPVSD